MLPADALTRPFVLFVTESPAADEGTVTYRRGCNAAVWCLCSSTVWHSLTDTPLAKTKHMLVSLFENRFFFFFGEREKNNFTPIVRTLLQIHLHMLLILWQIGVLDVWKMASAENKSLYRQTLHFILIVRLLRVLLCLWIFKGSVYRRL